MTTINDINKYLCSIIPPQLACEWDNVGLLVGSEDTVASKVLIALDVDENVAAEAAELGCELIVSHHPVIFHPLHSLTDRTPAERTVISLVKNGISVISAHTNLDQLNGGLNDLLASKLGIENLEILEVSCESDGVSHGFGRIGELDKAVTLKEILDGFSDVLGTKGLRYTGSLDRVIKRVAVNSGGGSDALYAAAGSGADLFVTGDVKYNPFRDARDLDIALIDAGHYETEFMATELFYDMISNQFPDLKLFITKTNLPVTDFYVSKEK